ncbi:hypothetical protein PsYK624_160320 [Phanerochaete sordida]|uniref:F-box domain-containing protein n=1 Tax=Phanerochaete sordida TaxID=48140 RepID=A0A9P3LLQ2_9APHY|nr:hypothetical protein PsYK624_160320 [Phanerochaete sordida]
MSSKFCISGPVLAQAASDVKPYTAIEFYALKSKIRGTEPRIWTLDDLPEFETFCFDWYQDLLVLVESPDDEDDYEVLLYLLQCTTGEEHPDNLYGSLYLELPTEGVDGWFHVQVCGGLVAVHYEYGDHLFFELWVFDWRENRLLLHLGVDEESPKEERWKPHDFALLDSRHVVVSTGSNSPQQILAVFDCYSDNLPIHERLLFTTAVSRYASLVLELPPLIPVLLKELFVTLHCNPDCPSALASQVANAPFRAGGSPVLLVCLSTYDANDKDVMYDLIIPGDVLLSPLSKLRARKRRKAPPHIHWKTYARKCQLIDMSESFVDGVVHGSRYASLGKAWQSTGAPHEGEFLDVITVYHFGPLAGMLRNADDDNHRNRDSVLSPSVSTVLKDPGSGWYRSHWKKPRKVGAPYQYTWTGLALPDSGGPFYLVEDGLVINYDDVEMRAYTF